LYNYIFTYIFVEAARQLTVDWEMLWMWQGQPKLAAVDETKCEYRFEWRTAVVCKIASVTVKPVKGDCKYDYKEGSVFYDLSILSPSANGIRVRFATVL